MKGERERAGRQGETGYYMGRKGKGRGKRARGNGVYKEEKRVRLKHGRRRGMKEEGQGW